MARKTLASFSMALAIFAATNGSVGAAAPLLTGGSWHRAHTELYSPIFSPNGDEIALVTKRHIPDAEEAESLTEARLRRHEAPIDRDPRFADPVIYTLRLRDRKVERVDYGWDPAFSPDGMSVAFAYQLKPISRFRVLAETLAGNDIRVFDRKSKVSRVVAQVDSGHLSSPIFSPDGRAIVFGLGDATNGAYAGLVGIGRVDVASHHVADAYPKLKLFNLARLIDHFGFVGQDLFAIAKTPTGPGIYLANAYRIELVKIEAEPQVVYSWGIVPLTAQLSFGFAAAADGSLRVFDKTWKDVRDSSSASSGSQVATDVGVVSPDGRWLARRGKGRLEIVEMATNRLTRTSQTSAQIEGITWSPDSERLAWIAFGDVDKFRFDELRVMAP